MGERTTWVWCLRHCTRLQRLSLQKCEYVGVDANKVAAWAAPALTWLECSSTFNNPSATLVSLPRLPALRELVWWEYHLPPLPASWTSLTRLERSAFAAEKGAAQVQAARAANPALTVAVHEEEVSWLVSI